MLCQDGCNGARTSSPMGYKWSCPFQAGSHDTGFCEPYLGRAFHQSQDFVCSWLIVFFSTVVHETGRMGSGPRGYGIDPSLVSGFVSLNYGMALYPNNVQSIASFHVLAGNFTIFYGYQSNHWLLYRAYSILTVGVNDNAASHYSALYAAVYGHLNGLENRRVLPQSYREAHIQFSTVHSQTRQFIFLWTISKVNNIGVFEY